MTQERQCDCIGDGCCQSMLPGYPGMYCKKIGSGTDSSQRSELLNGQERSANEHSIELADQARQEIETLRRHLKTARVRIEILHERNEACRAEFHTTHGVSTIEVPGWLEEMDDLLASRLVEQEQGQETSKSVLRAATNRADSTADQRGDRSGG